MSEDTPTFIIVTKPETGFLWDQLSQRERLESLKNIMTKKLGNEMEESSIDILVNTINNMYLEEYRTSRDPLNYKYSETKMDQQLLLAKFKKILQETNWIIPIVFDRRKVTPDSITQLDPNAVYTADPYYADRKIKEYYNNINSRLLQKIQNPYIAPKSLDAKQLLTKLGPFTLTEPRKAVWYVNIPKSGKVEYSQLKEPRVILENDKIYLNGLILDPALKDHSNFLKWYFSPGKDIDFRTEKQDVTPVSNEHQRIYRIGEADMEKRKDLIVKKTIDQYNYIQLLDENADILNNKDKLDTIDEIRTAHLKNEEYDLKTDGPLDTIYNIHKWPYFIVKFQDIEKLTDISYPLETSKYDSKPAFQYWLSTHTNFQHLVYLIEKILTDLDVKTVEQAKAKLNSIKAEFDKNLLISKGYCEKEKCPTEVYATIGQVLENLTYLVEEYTKLKFEATYDKKHKEIIAESKNRNEHQKLMNDILLWGIKNIYGSEVYNKVYSGQKLSDKEKETVDKFLRNIAEKRKAFLNNDCPHVPLRKKFDNTRNFDSKMMQLDTLLNEYSAINPEESDSGIQISCKLCGYNLACKHEKLILLASKQKNKENNQYHTELVEKFYANSYLDYIQNIVSCKECGRKIKDLEIEIQVDYEKDSASNDRSIRTGHTVYSQLQRLAQSELTKILYYTNLRVMYPDTPSKLFNVIEPVIEEDLRELEERIHEQTRAKEKRVLLYVNTAIIGKLVFDSLKVDFNNRLLTDFQPVAEIVAKMTKLIADLKRNRNDIKKYYNIHNELVDISINYFIKLIKSNDKTFVKKIGIEEEKFDKILHAFIKKYYLRFSEQYKFGVTKADAGKIKFVRKGKIYLVDDIRYKIDLPDKLETNAEYEQEIKKGQLIDNSRDHLIGLLTYLNEKRWVWYAQNVSPTAILNDPALDEFNKLNTQKVEIMPGNFAQLPNKLIQDIHRNIYLGSPKKNKTVYQGKKEELIFDITDTGATLKYVDFNYLLYCPNGRPHLWIKKSTAPGDNERICYWCKLTSTATKEMTAKMTDKEYQELQKNIQDAKIIEYFRGKCTDHTPHNFYYRYCLNCGEDYETIFNPGPDRIKILKTAWDSKPTEVAEAKITNVAIAQKIDISGYLKDNAYISINKNKLHEFVNELIKQISNIAEKDVKKDMYQSAIIKDTINKIFSKGVKNFKPLIDTLTENLSNLGYFERRYKDDLSRAKKEEVQKIKLRYKSEQLREIRSYIDVFFQHISLILNNSRSYIIQDIVGTEYIQQFINDKRDDFVKFIKELSIDNYSAIFESIMSDYKIKLKTKSRILQNILIHDILTKLIGKPHTALFILGYLDRIMYSFAQIGDRTAEEREFIDLITEEKVLAKRLKFYRKLHEEKVEAGLAFADFEEQEAYFDAEKDTFQLENEDAPDTADMNDVQMDDDIIDDIHLDELDVDTDIFDGAVYEADHADRELIYSNNL